MTKEEQNSYMFDTIALQEQQIEKMKCDKRDSIVLQIETNIRKAFSKCNGLELLLICKVIDIVRDTLSE